MAVGSVRSATAPARFEIEGEQEAAERLLTHLISGFQQVILSR
jgi:hypothetical protein